MVQRQPETAQQRLQTGREQDESTEKRDVRLQEHSRSPDRERTTLTNRARHPEFETRETPFKVAKLKEEKDKVEATRVSMER